MKNKDVRKKFISFLIVLYSVTTVLLISIRAFSVESFERIEFYNGVRALGMGGVTVPTVNDETALISNPAALGKLRNKFFTLADPELDGNKVSGDHNGEDPMTLSDQEPQDLLDGLILKPDEHYHAAGQVFPSFVVPNFGIGLLGTWITNAEVLAATSEFDVYYRNDYAGIIGYSLRFFDGRIKIGFNARYINRVEADTKRPSNSTLLKWKDLVSEGTGVGSDVGLLITGPWTYLPTIGAVLRDVGDTSYTLSSGFQYSTTVKPEKTKSTLDVGFSVTPIVAKHIRVQIAGEYRDALEAIQDDEDEATEEDAMKRVHAGMELNIYDKLFLRGGYHQRYYTGGVEIAGPMFSFQAATYGEEIGTKDEPREDRRYVLKFSIRF